MTRGSHFKHRKSSLPAMANRRTRFSSEGDGKGKKGGGSFRERKSSNSSPAAVAIGRKQILLPRCQYAIGLGADSPTTQVEPTVDITALHTVTVTLSLLDCFVFNVFYLIFLSAVWFCLG